MDDALNGLREILVPFAQEQVLRFWDRLDGPSRLRLARQIQSFDFELIDGLVKTHVPGEVSAEPIDFDPIEVVRLAQTDSERRAFERARAVGERLLSEARAACVVVAGGQGTRLGYDGPKGTFPIAPVSGKSIFQLHVEKIRALAGRLDGSIPLFVMTRAENDAVTREFFKRNKNFGLSDEDVFFLVQGTMPAVDFSGKLILDAPDHIVENPNGHGGVMPALVES
ncbi:unnamed protein product, partial [marine sediment metagenome]